MITGTLIQPPDRMNAKAIMLNSKKNCEKLCLLNAMQRFRCPIFIITWALSQFVSWHSFLCCFNGTHIQMFSLLLQWADNLMTDECYSKVLDTFPTFVCICVEVARKFQVATVPIKIYLMAFTASVLLSQLICQTDKVRKWVSYRRRASGTTLTDSLFNQWSVLSQPPHSNNCRFAAIKNLIYLHKHLII